MSETDTKPAKTAKKSADEKLDSELAAMPKSVRDFIIYKSVIENRSKHTVEEYTLDLRTFFRYIKASRCHLPKNAEALASVDISDIDDAFAGSIETSEIYEFLMYAGRERENEWSARARKLSAIKVYYKFMTVKTHRLENNPAVNIESPKKNKTLPKHLSVSECKDLLSAVENDPLSKTKERDYAIITMFLNCGMRLSELVGIDVTDIDSEMRSLVVTGKGNKERIIYMNDACRAALSDYLPKRFEALQRGVNFPALFLSRLDKRISPKTVQWLVYKYLGEAGLDFKGYSAHKLRHTAATLMYQSGKVDVRVLKDILGHEQLNTTQIYTHVSDASMENAVRENPLAGITPDKSKKTGKE